LVGYYEAKNLTFIGKIKNGFIPALRRQVAEHLMKLKRRRAPFTNLPEARNAVAQIEFTEWTKGNHLRHSGFVGLRDDKNAKEVTREVAA